MATNTLDFQREAQATNLPGSKGDFGTFLSGLMSAVMVIGAILVFAFLIWGGIEWITSAGDKSKLESARNKIQNSLLGLIVLAATTALFMLIQQFLDICVLRIGGSC